MSTGLKGVPAVSPLAPSRHGTYPCKAMGGHEIDFDACTSTTRMPVRNRTYCCVVKCQSPWRHCSVCLEQGNLDEPWVYDAETGLCHFHTLNGASAVRGKPAPKLSIVSQRPAPVPTPVRRNTLEISADAFERESHRTPPARRPVTASPASPPAEPPQSLSKEPDQAAVSAMIPEEKSAALARMVARMRGFKERRHDVLRLLGEGLTNPQIARRLGTNTNNVSTVVSTITRILEVPEAPGSKSERDRKRRQMVIEAYQLYAGEHVSVTQKETEQKSIPERLEPVERVKPPAPAVRRSRRMKDVELSVPQIPATSNGAAPNLANFNYAAVDRWVGMRIRHRRRLLDMSQQMLADCVGLTFQQIQKYERGDNRVSASKLYGIASILKVPVSYFFEGLDQADPSSADESCLWSTYMGKKIQRALDALDEASRVIQGLEATSAE